MKFRLLLFKVADAQPGRVGKVLSSDDELLNHVVCRDWQTILENVGLMSRLRLALTNLK